MTRPLPRNLEQAFGSVAGELGMCSAAWLFVREVAEAGGDAMVTGMRDRLGREYPVLDAVCSAWLGGARAPRTDPSDVLRAVDGASHVVIVGVETDFLDALVPRLPRARLALLRHSAFDVAWERVLANYEGRLEALDLDSFQAWAGRRSVLLTFAYGSHDGSVSVVPVWQRATGEDVRTQFRSLVAWDVLRAPMHVYPRWLVEVPETSFTDRV